MSGGNSGRIFALSKGQDKAVDPIDSVWLSAAAGTGKTQVLSARVLRLLLREDVAPEQILCLTFTKAGAAEMANRVNAVLAQWVRMPETRLGTDLLAIGASNREEVRIRARSLFARVLDTPSGGLRINTIHAFSQWLLSAFPEEAGLTPGTQALEDRDRDPLARATLTELLEEWQAGGDTEMLDALAALSMRFGPDGAQGWLMRCAQAGELWLGAGGWPDNLRERLLRVLDLPTDLSAETVVAACGDEAFDVAAVQDCIRGLETWGTKTAKKAIAPLRQWLALSAHGRAEALDLFAGSLFTKGSFGSLDLVPAGLTNIEKKVPDYGALAEQVADSLRNALEAQRALALAEWLVPALRVGRRFALRWDEVKRREALMDYDDQIRLAANLLRATDTRWIQFKLDRDIDHILLDEAQDTNVEQWTIIKALVDEYYDGAGQREECLRTLFVVGDYKQAIFGFQGTSPENFTDAKDYFAGKITRAAASPPTRANAPPVRDLADLDLAFSYRTSQPILDVVDDAITAIGPECFGLPEAPPEHSGDTERPGEVVLWEPIPARPDDEDVEEGTQDGWLPAPERRMADRIAGQIKAWLKDGYPLYKSRTQAEGPRNAEPGDIMVLVRSRKELAGLIVSRLFAAGVPVAGVDRLRLGAPLVVKDMLAALRFAAQPRDDLMLANLLVSPLIGWSQEALLEHGYRPHGVPLWRHLRDSEDRLVGETVAKLKDLLARADYEPVQALLHWMLVGPWSGRKALTARLGSEANDAIDELLNVAAQYEAAHTASLPGFLHWFDGGDGELKREAGAQANEVRVLTVHGAKGLQAPIVILADATANPDHARPGALTLMDDTRPVPLPPVCERRNSGGAGRCGGTGHGARPRGTLAAALCRDDPRGGGAVCRRRAGQAR